MKKILLTFALASIASFLYGTDLVMKDGSKLNSVTIVSKNQYGVDIAAGQDKEGKTIVRNIRFSELSPGSLRLFPFSDSKTIDRLFSALRDRADIAAKKYADERKEIEESKDEMVKAAIPGGVNSIKVFFVVTDQAPEGVIGWAHSDTPDAAIYGKIYIHGIKIDKNLEWTGELYPTSETLQFKSKKYLKFTLQPTEESPVSAVSDNGKNITETKNKTTPAKQ